MYTRWPHLPLLVGHPRGTLGRVRIDELPTPSLIIDVARLDANIAAMAERMRSAGVALRPHFKTSKCLEIISSVNPKARG